jgi:methylglyoxal synthase
MKEDKLRVAVIAHDNRKADLVAFVMHELDHFKGVEIVATGTTGGFLERAGLLVERKASGPLGGDAQIAAEIVAGRIDGVIFIIDPLSAHPHEVDIQMLLRICNVKDVPIATNLSTARLLVHGKLKG